MKYYLLATFILSKNQKKVFHLVLFCYKNLIGNTFPPQIRVQTYFAISGKPKTLGSFPQTYLKVWKGLE